MFKIILKPCRILFKISETRHSTTAKKTKSRDKKSKRRPNFFTLSEWKCGLTPAPPARPRRGPPATVPSSPACGARPARGRTRRLRRRRGARSGPTAPPLPFAEALRQGSRLRPGDGPGVGLPARQDPRHAFSSSPIDPASRLGALAAPSHGRRRSESLTCRVAHTPNRSPAFGRSESRVAHRSELPTFCADDAPSRSPLRRLRVAHAPSRRRRSRAPGRLAELPAA